MTFTNSLIIGGVGFISSHLVDALISLGESEVHVFDNLSSGRLKNIKWWLHHRKFKFIRGDLLNATDVAKTLENCEIVFYLAANPDVRVSSISPNTHFQQNIVATYNLLETVSNIGRLKHSSSHRPPRSTVMPQRYPTLRITPH